MVVISESVINNEGNFISVCRLCLKIQNTYYIKRIQGAY